MTNRPYTFLTAVIGVICGFVIIRTFLSADSLTVRNDLVQGLFVGAGSGVVAVEILARIKATRVNGWITLVGCGLPGNGIITRAACARIFPGPVNVPQEAMYWRTGVDGAGHTLSGEHDYILRFPPGGLPPNDAFWSLTMADAKQRFVANPIDRYSVSDRSGLAQNPDGSVDIYLQNAAPADLVDDGVPALASVRFGRSRGMLPRRLPLAAHHAVRVQEGDPRERVRRGPHSGQHSLYGAPSGLCRSAPCGAIRRTTRILPTSANASRGPRPATI